MPLANMNAFFFLYFLTNLARKTEKYKNSSFYILFELCIISMKADYRKGRENHFHFK